MTSNAYDSAYRAVADARNLTVLTAEMSGYSVPRDYLPARVVPLADSWLYDSRLGCAKCGRLLRIGQPIVLVPDTSGPGDSVPAAVWHWLCFEEAPPWE